MVTHVNDILVGLCKSVIMEALAQTKKAFSFAKWGEKEFIFRGRELIQYNDCSVAVKMKQYALSLSGVTMTRERKKQIVSPLTEGEIEPLRRWSGSLVGSADSCARIWPFSALSAHHVWRT